MVTPSRSITFTARHVCSIRANWASTEKNSRRDYLALRRDKEIYAVVWEAGQLSYEHMLII